jgi:large subunit ribosomal protein L13
LETVFVDPHKVERKWYVVDGTGKTLGRLASQVASVLRGKHKPLFAPNLDMGDHVIIVNAEKVTLTGRKLEQKMYYRHTLHPGGLKVTPYGELMAKNPELAIKMAVKGMLPHSSIGAAMLKKLRVYKGSEHPHSAQKPEVMEIID